ncbi:MAG: 30S ribosomal protein S20 [Defluviitaleaceae bacterium]|nr:30S ribosomal protein S20 [Defluviitaleaceae bacterium]
MANSKSAKKRILVSGKKQMNNRIVKSRTKTAIKKAVGAINTDVAAATPDFTNAISLIDRAATKGVLHKNTAARRKSKLQKMLNQAG